MSAALDLHRVARALGGKVSGGQIIAPGPNHSPADESLSVRLEPSAPEGFVVHSFANDDPLECRDYVRAKAGLPDWQPSPKPAPLTMMGDRGKVAAEYIYRLADGTPYLRVTRRDRPGGKSFSQAHIGPSGWTSGKPAGPKIPYRLDEMRRELASVAHTTVYVTEGEKCADALWRLGLIATTASEGAGKWTEDLNEHFAGLTVYILADNDKPGEAHAEQVASGLLGVAETVRIVRLPNLPPKGDVVDWIAAGGDKTRLTDFCKAQPVYTGKRSRGLTAAQLQGMVFNPVRYVVEGYIAEGLTIVAGKPKLGKSWLVLDICNAVAKGGYTLGDIKCTEGDVLYCALEDNPRRLKSRMAAVCPMTPWPQRLTFWHADDMPRLDEGGTDALREWIEAQPNPRLIVLDTLSYVRPNKKRDEDSYAHDQRSIRPIKELADEFGIAIVVVHHTRKMGADDQLEAVSGTNGLTGAADTILVLDRGTSGCTLYGRGRDIEEIETAVEFQRDTCRWRVLGQAADVHRSDERTAIIEALRGECDPVGPREVADVTGQSYASVRQTLGRMAKAGEVEKAGRGKYRLPNTPPVTSVTTSQTGRAHHE